MKPVLLSLALALLMFGCGEEAQKEAVQKEAVQEEAVQKEVKDESAAPFGDNFTVPDLNLTMIWVKPGTFMMGSPESESGRYDGEVQHEVTLTNGFYLGKYELTQAQWAKVMGSDLKDTEWPEEYVSWVDAVVFCKKLTEMEKKAGRVPEGMAYQLPTEAQWEYACRAGTTTAFSWGDSIKFSNANYEYDVSDFWGNPIPVGKYPPNPWGFHDMHGNVWEWCADWYGPYPIGSVTNPEGPAAGSNRVARGGSWKVDGVLLRSARRRGPGNNPSNLGTRVSLRASKGKPLLPMSPGFNSKEFERTKRLAESGNKVDQNNLGVMYEKGEGVPQDYKEAFKWYTKAAEQGQANAQRNLGRMYLNGQGVPRDWVYAYAWFNLADANGVKKAIGWRDEFELTPEQLEEAKALSTEIQKRIEANKKD